jgi:prepilin-type N-terminal cleavage/methylation domain-containing protein
MKYTDQKGFTLLELLVSTGIMSILIAIIGVGIFQAIALSQKANYRVQALSQTRNAVHWMARDIPMAQSTDLVDGGAPVSDATFTWTDVFADAQTPHALSYALVGGELRRTYDGTTITIGRSVSSIGFSRIGRLVTATVDVQINDRFQSTDQKMVKALFRGSG